MVHDLSLRLKLILTQSKIKLIQSMEHGLMKVGLKSWKVGMSQAKKREFKKQQNK